MNRLAAVVLAAALCVVCYALGRSHAQVKIVATQMETLHHVEQKKAEIHSRPNADRAALLALMRAGQL